MKTSVVKSMLSLVLAVFVSRQMLASYKDEVLSDSPIGYWRLDQPPGPPPPPLATAMNLGSVGVTGNGSYDYFVRGQQPGALIGSTDTAAGFAGSTTAQVPYAPELNPAPPFTVEAWVRPNVTLTGTTLTCPLSSLTGSSGWLFYQTARGWNLRAGDASGYTVNIAGTTIIQSNTWYHLAGIFDGTTADIYVNGTKEATGSIVTFEANFDQPIGIGARGDRSFFFNGEVDEVAIYASVLSSSEVTAHYANGTNASPAQPYDSLVLAGNPIGYWRLDEAQPLITFTVATNSGSLGSAGDGLYSLYGVSNGAPGALKGDPDTAANFTQALQGKAEVPFDASLNPFAFTIECWAQVTGADGSYRSPMTSRDFISPTTAGYIFYASAGDAWEFWTGTTGVAGNPAWDALGGRIPATVTDGQWVHLVGTYDGRVKNFYVDGVLVGAGIVTNFVPNMARPLRIGGGATEGPGNYFFEGSVDEVAIYNRVLSGDRVLAHYKTALGGTEPAAVAPEIAVDLPAAPINVFKGSTLALAAAVTGSLPLSYQWQFNGSDIPGQTNGTLVLANLQVTNSGAYMLTVSNSSGSATTAPATVSVSDIGVPVITQQPQSRTVLPGSRAVFTVVATGSATFDYQWQFKAATADSAFQPVAGATNSALVISNAQTGSLGAYKVTVSNPAGTVESDPATLSFPTPAASYVSAVMADGPVAYWRLGEASGTDAMDQINNAHPGEYLNGVILGEPGAIIADSNTAARFNGIDQRAEIPYAQDLNTPPLTVEVWANVGGNAGTYRSPFTSRADFPQRGLVLYAAANDRWEFWNGRPAGGWDVLSGPPVVMGTWAHLVAIHDGTNKTFYVNGELIGSMPNELLPNDEAITRIGAGATESPNGNYFFAGVIDEVAVYPKVLSQERILTHFVTALTARPQQIAVDIRLTQSSVILSWPSGVLQEVAELTGTWTDLTNAASPYTVNPLSAARKFYRVRN